MHLDKIKDSLVKINSIFCFLLLTACGKDSNNNTQERQSEAIQRAAEDSAAEDLRAYPPTKYTKYPRNVRSPIRSADMENDHCRGGTGNDPETYRACNRRDKIMVELEKKGWCWGGSNVGYLKHWLRCSDDPYYQPSQPASNPPYSEEEIKEATQPDTK